MSYNKYDKHPELISMNVTDILTEIANVDLEFFHGSPTPLKLNQVLEANRIDQASFRASSKLTSFLERYKPDDQPSRMECWFLCDSKFQVKISSGSTKYIYVVQPNTPVFKHYYGWIALADQAIGIQAAKLWKSDRYEHEIRKYRDTAIDELAQTKLFSQMLTNYWTGVEIDKHLNVGFPPDGLRLVEYTTQSITVISRAP